MNPVVHFEMPAEDRDRMAGFYSEAFGWKMQMMGEEMGNYVVAVTSEMDEKSMRPKMPGTINGGFYPVKKGDPPSFPSVVISVEDIQSSMKKITAGGGKLLGEPINIPNVGQFIAFIDTEGNRVSILQPSM